MEICDALDTLGDHPAGHAPAGATAGQSGDRGAHVGARAPPERAAACRLARLALSLSSRAPAARRPPPAHPRTGRLDLRPAAPLGGGGHGGVAAADRAVLACGPADVLSTRQALDWPGVDRRASCGFHMGAAAVPRPRALARMPPLPLTTLLQTALPHVTADPSRPAPTAAGLTPEFMESTERKPFERSTWRLPRHPTPVLTARLPVTGRPFDVVIGRDQAAYVTRGSAASVDCVLLDPLRAGGSVPTGAVPTRLALSRGGNRAYVTNQFTEDIGVIDLQRSRQIGAIAVPGHPMAVVLSRDGRTLFVTTNLDHLYAIPLGTGSAMACAAVTERLRRDGLDPSGTRLYVPTWRAGDRARGRAAG